MNRDKFEKLPKIKSVLNSYSHSFVDGYYSFKGNTNDQKVVYAMGFVNGAYHAFCEQEKRIDAALSRIDEKCNEFCESHDMDKVVLLEEIEELLK